MRNDDSKGILPEAVIPAVLWKKAREGYFPPAFKFILLRSLPAYGLLLGVFVFLLCDIRKKITVSENSFEMIRTETPAVL